MNTTMQNFFDQMREKEEPIGTAYIQRKTGLKFPEAEELKEKMADAGLLKPYDSLEGLSGTYTVVRNKCTCKGIFNPNLFCDRVLLPDYECGALPGTCDMQEEL